MTTEQTSEPEVPDDQRRRQIVVKSPVRSYLRSLTEGSSTTYSQQIDAWLPHNHEDVYHSFADEEVVTLKTTPEIHAKVDSMTGPRVSPGQVIAYWGLKSALRNGDYDVAGDLAEHVPELLWKTFEAGPHDV